MNTIFSESMILILTSKTYFEPSCEGSLLFYNLDIPSKSAFASSIAL